MAKRLMRTISVRLTSQQSDDIDEILRQEMPRLTASCLVRAALVDFISSYRVCRARRKAVELLARLETSDKKATSETPQKQEG